MRNLLGLTSVFEVAAPKILEVIARVVIIYFACMVLLRVSGRREMSQLSPMDLLTMLLLSEAVSPALTGNDETITSNVVGATTLVALAMLSSWLAVRSSRIERMISGEPVLLVLDGKVRPGMMRRFRITDVDLRSSLHDAGVLTVKDVARAFVEPDGHITVIKQSDLDASRERHHRKGGS